MNPDDATALEALEAELAAEAKAGRPPSAQFIARVPWLARVCRDLVTRNAELEKGSTDTVLASKDALIAQRDKALAVMSDRYARMEALKLPSNEKIFRENVEIPAETKGALDFVGADVATVKEPPQAKPVTKVTT